MPRSRIEQLPKEQRDKYIEWEEKGFLTIHELDYNDQSYIFDDLMAFMSENNLYPVGVGYDKWNAQEIVRLFESNFGDICYNVPQTVKGLSNHLKIYKSKSKVGKVIFNDPVSTWCHLNVMVKVDANGNIFPNKEKAKNKIDVFASQLDAFVVYENEKEKMSYYFEK
jgi:phage terminase large subunit-like protein